jgi:hypothetical protein
MLVYRGSPVATGVIVLTQPLNSAQPAADAEAEATPTIPAVELRTTKPSAHHPALVALVRILARQAAQEHFAAEVARHGR